MTPAQQWRAAWLAADQARTAAALRLDEGMRLRASVLAALLTFPQDAVIDELAQRLPSYLDREQVSVALVSLAADGHVTPLSIAGIRTWSLAGETREKMREAGALVVLSGEVLK